MKPKLTELEFVRLNAPNVWDEYVMLQEFYKTVAKLTLNHDVRGDAACVTADHLGLVLQKIDNEWWKMGKD